MVMILANHKGSGFQSRCWLSCRVLRRWKDAKNRQLHEFAIDRCRGRIPPRLGDASQATRVNLAGILYALERIKNSGFVDSIVTGDDNWNSKEAGHYELLYAGETVATILYSQQLTRVHHSFDRQGVNTARTKLLQR